MIDRRHRLMLMGVGLLALNLAGCASGRSSFSAWRPGTGVWTNTPPGINGGRTWNGPLVQPGTGLQPTPAMSAPPSIVPGPALPDASGSRYRLFPRASGIRYPYPRRPAMPVRPPVVPQRGAPIAQQDSPSEAKPAELSGQIEIIPGPTLRARRARMEMLPPPPENGSQPVQGTSHRTLEEDSAAVHSAE